MLSGLGLGICSSSPPGPWKSHETMASPAGSRLRVAQWGKTSYTAEQIMGSWTRYKVVQARVRSLRVDFGWMWMLPKIALEVGKRMGLPETT